MGSGTARAVAPAPTPPSQVLGGVVVTPRVDGFSAAQNMYPSNPGVVPAPAGAAVCTQPLVEFCRDWLKLVHSGRTLEPSATNKLPVNFAGASGRIGGEYWGLPVMCSCQFDSALEVDGCLDGTMALA